MKAGRFVGRVGALAVALGVGAAVASNPWVAWADDGGSTGTDSAASSSTSGGSDGNSAHDAADNASKAASPRTKGDSGSQDGSAKDDSESRASAATDPSVRKAPAGTVVSTGGADTSTPKRATKKQQLQNDSAVAKDNTAVKTVALTKADDTEPEPSDPPTPTGSPLELAALAVGARTRNDGSEQTFAAAAVVNSAPTVPVQPIGTPDPVTGVVTGTVLASDADNNPLTYSVATGPKTWTVALNSQTGAYSYTPTPAARWAAGATPVADTDSFTVAVDDGGQASTATVSVYISPARLTSQSPIAVSTNPSAMAIGADGRMYVANTGSNTVSVINTLTGQRIDANSSRSAQDIAVGYSPSALALSADGTRLYVANTGSGTVSVIDTATYKRLDVNPSWSASDIKVGSKPSALAFGADGKLYVANSGSNTVSVIDTATNKMLDVNPNASGVQSISVGTSPSALALNGSRLYVANKVGNSVSVIDTSTFAVTATIGVGSQPSAVALAGGRLYVANAGNNTVSVIDVATNTVVPTAIPVGPKPTSVALNPTGTVAYVANGNDTVSVIDTATNTVLSTAAIDTDTTGGHVIALGADGRVYVSDAADKTVRVLAVRYGNTAPVAGTPTVGSPNTGDGAVTGSLNVTDADGDILSYSVTQPSAGTVTVTGAGIYTFTPTQAARQAAATGGPTTTTFTVNATDGQATTPVDVTVPIAMPFAPTQVTVLGSATITGDPPPAQPVLSPDGTRAVIVTPVTNAYTLAKTTRVVVINTATGKQVGSTLTLTGGGGAPVFNGDSSRVLITTTVPNTTTGIETTRVTVINTATGAQTGTPLTLSGSPSGIRLLGADGSRALITTDAYDVYDWDGTVAHSTGVAVINTATGTPVGTALTITGALSSVQLSGTNDSRALITTSDSSTAWATLVDTTTGAQIGTTVAVPGGPSDSQDIPVDDSHGLVITYDTTSGTTGVTVVDTATGAQIGTTVTIAGSLVASSVVADLGRALIMTQEYDDPYDTSTFTTRVAVVDTENGGQVGATLDLAGAYQHPTLSADGKHAVIAATVSPWGESWTVNTTRVALVDIASVSKTGTTMTLDGAASGQFSADGTRLLICTRYRHPTTGVESSQVLVVNTATGGQIGTTLNLSPASVQWMNADGSRALLNTSRYDPGTVSTTMRWTVLDTTTGVQTAGTTLTLHGYLSSGSTTFSDDGTKALVSTSTYDDLNHFATTYVTVINTATGAQVGSTLTLSGYPIGYPSPLVAVNGTRALIVTNPRDYQTSTDTTQIAVINTVTGTQVGTTLTFSGYPADTELLGVNGNLALIAIGSGSSTRVVVLNVITGAQTATFTVSGSPRGSVVFSADGTRALITTATSNSRTSVSTRVTVLKIA
jgi:YVTN family beta-propeller protein/VCBS repeat-containing protein